MKKSIVGPVSLFFFLSILVFAPGRSVAQSCTSNPTTISSDINFSAISWTAAGGATCPPGSSFTGDIIIDVANSTIITMNTNLDLTGNFILTGGPGSTLSLNTGVNVHVIGVTHYMGDPTNNGIQYIVNGTSTIVVDGTLYGKNNNAFTGSGSISGGALNVKNGSTCGSPCPVTGGFPNCTSGDGFCTAYSVPILLSSFNANVKGQVVELKWSTDAEINFSHFAIEKSSNGLTFNHLVDVTGSGNSNTRKDYSYTDQNPFIGNSYYRLTSIDFDGYTEVFNNNVVLVTVKAEKNFSVAPNPVQSLRLKGLVNFESTHGSVVIFDRMGSVVAKYAIGNSEIDLQLPTLSNGVYFAQFQSGEFSKTVRFAVNE